MYHIANAKKHGVTAEEMAEILTHGAFYAGWPNAWRGVQNGKGSIWKIKGEKRASMRNWASPGLKYPGCVGCMSFGRPSEIFYRR